MKYTKETIKFLKELPSHTEDSPWPRDYLRKYEQFLRDPTLELARQIQDRFIKPLAPDVEFGVCNPRKRPRGYKDHYVFAFYDPDAERWSDSVQLFFYLDSGKRSGKQRWYYGFSVWHDVSEEHLDNLNAVLRANVAMIADYFRDAPQDTIVEIGGDDEDEGEEAEEYEEEGGGEEDKEDKGEEGERLSPSEFANRLIASSGVAGRAFGTSYGITVFREYPLDSLLEHADNLVEEVGAFFAWTWKLFEASRTGRWPGGTLPPPPPPPPPPSAPPPSPPPPSAPPPSADLDELCQSTSLPYAAPERFAGIAARKATSRPRRPTGDKQNIHCPEVRRVFCSGKVRPVARVLPYFVHARQLGLRGFLRGHQARDHGWEVVF